MIKTTPNFEIKIASTTETVLLQNIVRTGMFSSDKYVILTNMNFYMYSSKDHFLNHKEAKHKYKLEDFVFIIKGSELSILENSTRNNTNNTKTQETLLKKMSFPSENMVVVWFEKIKYLKNRLNESSGLSHIMNSKNKSLLHGKSKSVNFIVDVNRVSDNIDKKNRNPVKSNSKNCINTNNNTNSINKYNNVCSNMSMTIKNNQNNNINKSKPITNTNNKYSVITNFNVEILKNITNKVYNITKDTNTNINNQSSFNFLVPEKNKYS